MLHGGGLADWLSDQNFERTRGAPSHPQTQGKIERWHQTLKNRILFENYLLPGDLEAGSPPSSSTTITGSYHESLDNLTPADIYFARGQTILLQRERIKRKSNRTTALRHPEPPK